MQALGSESRFVNSYYTRVIYITSKRYSVGLADPATRIIGAIGRF